VGVTGQREILIGERFRQNNPGESPESTINQDLV
jgi:hypothetical protein